MVTWTDKTGGGTPKGGGLPKNGGGTAIFVEIPTAVVIRGPKGNPCEKFGGGIANLSKTVWKI